MDGDGIEIDQIEDGHAVLAIPALRLIVMGRTLDEARAWARSAMVYRGLIPSQRAEPVTSGHGDGLHPRGSNAA